MNIRVPLPWSATVTPYPDRSVMAIEVGDAKTLRRWLGEAIERAEQEADA